jgi:mannose-6-phosphate isomerase-like protein (cupin superfamily)
MDRFVSNCKNLTPAAVEGLFGGAGRFLRFGHYTERDAPPFTVIAETEMAPGAYAGLHTQPDQQELLYLLAGTGRFSIDGVQQEVGPGDAILARAGAEFALANTGKEPLRYLVVKCRTSAG